MVWCGVYSDYISKQTRHVSCCFYTTHKTAFVFSIIFQHILMDGVTTHCAAHVEPGLDVTLPISQGVHVVELVAPITALYVDTGHLVHVEKDVAPNSAL